MERQGEIKRIEEEIRNTKYNKATQYHIGRLKAKLARLREGIEKKKTGKGKALSLRKSGDATVLLVGFPSVGKSTLMNQITSAESKTGDYDFTTLDVIPGVMKYNFARIQILDIPGIVSGASSGKGRGREILSFVRNADLILIMVDKPEQIKVIEKELYDSGFRLNEEKPKVLIKKTERGGIKVSSTVKLKHIDKKMVQLVVNERGIHNADVLIREDVTLEKLLDATSKNRVYVKKIVIYNKVDLLSKVQRNSLPKGFLQVSSLRGEGIEDLKKEIWEMLELMRIYMKKIRKPPDMGKPLIIRKGSKVRDVAESIHKDFERNLEYARIWGPSAKFDGQKVGGERILKDGDMVELHME
ncbi:MAG: GTP-binding protein [Candidatus Aenigmarchaeota archaeon]|nr:GTP-binding protein [Candidatus Aenigmarchaeota archaeon]